MDENRYRLTALLLGISGRVFEGQFKLFIEEYDSLAQINYDLFRAANNIASLWSTNLAEAQRLLLTALPILNASLPGPYGLVDALYEFMELDREQVDEIKQWAAAQQRH
jgi:hypothetical protein